MSTGMKEVRAWAMMEWMFGNPDRKTGLGDQMIKWVVGLVLPLAILTACHNDYHGNRAEIEDVTREQLSAPDVEVLPFELVSNRIVFTSGNVVYSAGAEGYDSLRVAGSFVIAAVTVSEKATIVAVRPSSSRYSIRLVECNAQLSGCVEHTRSEESGAGAMIDDSHYLFFSGGDESAGFELSDDDETRQAPGSAGIRFGQLKAYNIDSGVERTLRDCESNAILVLPGYPVVTALSLDKLVVSANEYYWESTSGQVQRARSVRHDGVLAVRIAGKATRDLCISEVRLRARPIDFEANEARSASEELAFWKKYSNFRSTRQVAVTRTEEFLRLEPVNDGELPMFIDHAIAERHINSWDDEQ